MYFLFPKINGSAILFSNTGQSLKGKVELEMYTMSPFKAFTTCYFVIINCWLNNFKIVYFKKIVNLCFV